jgi:hypothetical protein
VDCLLPMAADYNANNPDLSAFRDRGGHPSCAGLG